MRENVCKQGTRRKKALFITNSDMADETYGGPKGSQRNHILLSRYFDVDIYLDVKKSSFQSALTALRGYYPPTERSDIDNVRRMQRENNYDVVFFDNSTLGEFIGVFQKSRAKKIVFYHNCEHDYIDVRFGKKKSLKSQIYKILNNRSESRSTELADVRIALSKRDAGRIQELYGKKVDYILPLTIVDKYKEHLYKEHPYKEHPYKEGTYEDMEKSCLLFGPVGTANIEAFAWFTTHVSPRLHCRTIVAGKGFEQYRGWENDKVSVAGFVEDIAGLYHSVSCVAIPLLSGGGMKVKTVEAMMFGKYIFGTDEAFEGYDVDYSRIGGLCNDADSFVRAINRFVDAGTDGFNTYARELYATKYSVAASGKIFEQIMADLGFCKGEKWSCGKW